MPPDVDAIAIRVLLFVVIDLRGNGDASIGAGLHMEAVAEEDAGLHQRFDEADTVGGSLAGDVSGLRADADAVHPVDGAEKAGDKAGGGGEVNLAGAADLLNLSFIHHGNLIGEREGFFLIVGDKEEGDAEPLLELFQLNADALAEGGVKSGERFIKEQEFRLNDEGPGKRGALLFAAGETRRETIAFFLKAHEFEHSRHFRGDGAGLLTRAFEPEGDVLRGG